MFNPRNILLALLSVVALSCTSVSQMQRKYEAGDTSQFYKIAEIAGRQDYPYATRRAAAKALGEIADPRGVPILARILGEFDQRTTLKQESLIALGRLGDPQAVTAIGRLLDRSLTDTNDELRLAAMPVLGQLGGEEAATILVNALTYYDLIMVNREGRRPRGVFTGDEQSIRDLQDSLRAPTRRQGDLSGYGNSGAFGNPSGLFGGSLPVPDERQVDTVPQERELAHRSLVQVGEPAIAVIEQHMSMRETTISLRNELLDILAEIEGSSGSDADTAAPG